MAAWTNSELLQALGWATLNSFWQMGLLWGTYILICHLFNPSSTVRYHFSITGLLLGFAWFVYSFFSYNTLGQPVTHVQAVSIADSTLRSLMVCAAVTYLLLLAFPTARLLRSWQKVQAVRRQSGKAGWRYRLFVQTVSARLGIRQKVKLVVSEVISSPITVGYLKPIILLPVAALNQLSPTQVEAILLHELSHIRRRDYLFNLLASFIQTALYFNPFAKAFMSALENEREACCDATVLQFGYNPFDYASALLQLQKTAAQPVRLALAAAGKGQLLSRIEKIMGMEKKKTFRLVQALPLLLAAFCILAFNSLLILEDARSGQPMAYSHETVFNPWQLQPAQQQSQDGHPSPTLEPLALSAPIASTSVTEPMQIEIVNITDLPSATKNGSINSTESQFLPVAFDEDDHLTPEQKSEVSKTMQDAKTALTELQWKEMEKSIADAMNAQEKAMAKQEYLQEVDEVDWKAIEQNLKANYDKMDWGLIKESVQQAMAHVKMDSIQQVYQLALTELQSLQRQLDGKTKTKASPLPDASRQNLKLATQALRQNLDSLKAIIPTKKVIHL